MSGAEFARYLQDASNPVSDEQQKAVMLVLDKARPNDGADFDAATAEFITKTGEMLPEVREAMIREILTRRVNRAMVPDLLNYARQTPHDPTALALYQAIRPWAGDDQFEAFLSVAQFSKKADIRQAAEESAVAVIKRSNARAKLLAMVDKALKDADTKSREIFLRVKAAGGG